MGGIQNVWDRTKAQNAVSVATISRLIADDKDIIRFYTHPNCPQQNAVNERFNRTLREGFLEAHENLTDDLQQMNEAPADWLTGYNGFRPHRSQ